MEERKMGTDVVESAEKIPAITEEPESFNAYLIRVKKAIINLMGAISEAHSLFVSATPSTSPDIAKKLILAANNYRNDPNNIVTTLQYYAKNQAHKDFFMFLGSNLFGALKNVASGKYDNNDICLIHEHLSIRGKMLFDAMTDANEAINTHN
jgi:hypothetical protein